ncbi:MAG: NPCBM/NEW2 domain-containing protein [Planctomycetota bacterium]
MMSYPFQKLILRSICFSYLFLIAVTVEARQDVIASIVDGTKVTGQIESIDMEGKISGDGFAEVNFADIVALQFANQKSTPSGTIQLHTLAGGVVNVDQPIVEGDQVEFQSKIGIQSLPFQSIRGIVWKQSEMVDNLLKKPSKEFDRICVVSNDKEGVLDGIFEKITATHVHVEYAGKSRKILLEKVNAVVTADLDLRKPTGSLATLTAVDGSTLLGVISAYRDGAWRLESAGSDTLEIPSEYLTQISIESDRLQFLSDLEPISVEQKTTFALQRSWQRDKSIENNPITLLWSDGRSKQFNKGIGTQAYSRIEFENRKGFDKFSATVGIDRETESRGDCRAVVLGDGIEIWSERISGTEDPKELELDISGVQKLSLVVYPGEAFDLGDHLNWANARFIKTR